ncbi:isoprenyl transferase [Hohaiivirga grylli]|uniref:isoprenyl transferase n=1 Tax=Hohaiivirga grylli TaxID=3133970 RepID=UPI00387ED9B2
MPSKEDGSMPSHVAIICDGNGRWAKQRGLPRLEGHRRGMEALRKTIQAASELGIPYLSIFAFSSENWRRPVQEVSDLMGLLRLFVRRDLNDLHKRNVRVKIIGERVGLESEILSDLIKTEELTKDNTGLTLLIAFNYGGRQELVAATQAIAQDVVAGKLKVEDINLADIEQRLYTAGIPDPDIVIRTSGEQRISNFLTWQTVYSEFLFLPVFWPDFDGEALNVAIEEYGRRERRFGGL